MADARSGANHVQTDLQAGRLDLRRRRFKARRPKLSRRRVLTHVALAEKALHEDLSTAMTLEAEPSRTSEYE